MKKLRIYFTSDIHGYFYPTSYGDRTQKNLGLFKCANQFEKDGNTLIIDGGDILQGSAFTYYCNKKIGTCKSISQIMNFCGYDYVTLGNHDFNYGMDYLQEYLKELNAVCVCQNIRGKNNEVLFPYDIKIMENGLTVGIVGIVTDFVNIWEKKEHIEAIRIINPFLEAKIALEQLKEKVDITICIYHGGFEKDIETGKKLSNTTENIAYRICEELDFDILLTGHQHVLIEGQNVHGTFVVQPRENGQEFHYVEVDAQNKEKKIVSQCHKAHGKCDLTMYTAFHMQEKKIQEWLDNIVGNLEEELLPQSKLEMAANGSKIADFLNRIQLHYSGAQISAVSLANDIVGFKCKVTRRDIIATYPYPNTLVVLEISGKNLKTAVERSAEYFYMKENGELSISHDFLQPKVEHYNYDYYEGITYQIDPKRTIGNRVINLSYNGKIIMPDDRYTICINNYRASGAGNYHMYLNCRVEQEINIEMVDLIMDYFEMKNGQTIDLEPSRKICVYQNLCLYNSVFSIDKN